MEQPFPKRPRLSMFADGPSREQFAQDLGALRIRNDLDLKCRFESIFEKYSHDFSGVGDEIDLATGEIVVDNGHLHGMENETDVGATDEDIKGRMLLRAMVETSHQEEALADCGQGQVMQSIEGIAETMDLIHDDSDPDDPGHDGARTPQLHHPLCTPPDSRGSDQSDQADKRAWHTPQPSDSEDSLFQAVLSERSASPDSLFDEEETRRQDGPRLAAMRKGTPRHDRGPAVSNAVEDVDDASVLARFGPEIGQEVVEMLRRARTVVGNSLESHIEPAWRLPVTVAARLPRTASQPTQARAPPANPPTPPAAPQSQPPIVAAKARRAKSSTRQSSASHGRSLWRPPPRRGRTKDQGRSQRSATAESEDPLHQDDTLNSDACHFKSEESWREVSSASDDVDDDDDDDVDKDWKDTDGATPEAKPKTRRIRRTRPRADEAVVLKRQGICVFCSRQFASRAGVWAHWNQTLRQAGAGKLDADDVHDLDYIHNYRAEHGQSSRKPRLVVSDFQTLVELHEVAGISFAEIAASRAMRTHKSGPYLHEVYDKHRSPPGSAPGAGSVEWSKDELATLRRLCENPIRDLSTFPTRLPQRSIVEIGDKLAEIWLQPFRDRGCRVARPSTKENPTRDGPDGELGFLRSASLDPLDIVKKEDSDDELFRL